MYGENVCDGILSNFEIDSTAHFGSHCAGYRGMDSDFLFSEGNAARKTAFLRHLGNTLIRVSDAERRVTSPNLPLLHFFIQEGSGKLIFCDKKNTACVQVQPVNQATDEGADILLFFIVVHYGTGKSSVKMPGRGMTRNTRGFI